MSRNSIGQTVIQRVSRLDDGNGVGLGDLYKELDYHTEDIGGTVEQLLKYGVLFKDPESSRIHVTEEYDFERTSRID